MLKSELWNCEVRYNLKQQNKCNFKKQSTEN